MKQAVTILILTILTATAGFCQFVDLRTRWKFNIGDKKEWAEANYDDSDWEIIWAPSQWEEEGFYGYDGFAWYRKKVDGKELPKNEKVYLNLGYIDDADEVYFNGELIGFSGAMPPKFRTAYNAERNYLIPTGLINYSGENTIAIRIFDATLSGGIIGGDLGIYPLEDRSPMLIDLQGLWSFALSRSGRPVESDEDWEKIMVPIPWEKQGFRRYDGFAWYRTTFELPQGESKENLILLLGKIDDFDEVYLNGELIGATNDRRRYGRSNSWAQKRAYDIPSHLIKLNGKNSIEILVEDIGNEGGIYEGPVGITTKSKYYRYFR
ncbi:MAG: beta galactosidase jelly roll domain-containing protein [Bacteroidota bacterium]